MPFRGVQNNNMITLENANDWNITRRKLKQKWIKLTLDNLPCVECEHDDLVRHRSALVGLVKQLKMQSWISFPTSIEQPIYQTSK